MAKDKKTMTQKRMEAATKSGLQPAPLAYLNKTLDKAFSGDTESGKKEYDKFFMEAREARKYGNDKKISDLSNMLKNLRIK